MRGESLYRALRAKAPCAALVGALQALACAQHGSDEPPRSPRHANEAEPGEFAQRLPGTIVSPDEALTAEQLFTRGLRDFEARHYAAAIARFERLLHADPNARWAPDAAYYAGLAHEELGEHERAARAFSLFLGAFEESARREEALIRAARLWVFLERYEAAHDAALPLMREAERSEGAGTLRPNERVVVLSALALAALSRESMHDAEAWIVKGRAVVELHGLASVGTISRDVAQLFFALGELRKWKSEQIRFDPLPPDFAQVFERRAQLLLDAQGAYADVTRAEDARWSAMAGVRIAELYERLHQDVIAMPRPIGADTDRLRGAFEGAVRVRYVVLLEKGLDVVERTLRMAERTSERSDWVRRAEESRRRMRRRLEEEHAALELLPHSRDDLERILLELQTRKRSR